MAVYLSTGVGPVRVSHRIGGRSRRTGGNPFMLILIAPFAVALMLWWIVVPLALVTGLVLTALAVVTSPFGGRGRRFTWATHAFTAPSRTWKLIVRAMRKAGMA